MTSLLVPSIPDLLPFVQQGARLFNYPQDSMVRITTSDAPSEVIAAFGVVGMVILGVVTLVWIRGRARVEERRLELLRELAARGQVTAQTLEEHLRPRSRLKRAVLIAAWFGLFGGTALCVIANDGYRNQQLLAPGIAILLASIATLSAPLMLREMRRANAL